MILQDQFVRLEPLTHDHVDALVEAARDRSTFALAPVPRDRAEMFDYVSRAGDTAFAVVREEKVVGSIRFMNLEYWSWPAGPILVDGEPRKPGGAPDVVEIGHAWLAPAAQRTAVFTTCLLLMTHAFESWRVHRLTLKTDARNQRSRDAILRLGAHFEGILRAHLPAADGIIRDTAMFSVLPAEWPSLRKRLESQLASPHNA